MCYYKFVNILDIIIKKWDYQFFISTATSVEASIFWKTFADELVMLMAVIFNPEAT